MGNIYFMHEIMELKKRIEALEAKCNNYMEKNLYYRFLNSEGRERSTLLNQLVGIIAERTSNNRKK